MSSAGERNVMPATLININMCNNILETILIFNNFLFLFSSPFEGKNLTFVHLGSSPTTKTFSYYVYIRHSTPEMYKLSTLLPSTVIFAILSPLFTKTYTSVNSISM